MKNFKKIIAGLLMGTMILGNVAIAFAEPMTNQNITSNEAIEVQNEQQQVIKSIVFSIGKDTYYVNGKTPGVKMDAVPFIEKDRTFVPVRFIGNALGVTDENIGWEHSQQKVTLSYKTTVASMVIGSKDIYSNSVKTAMDVAPQIKPPGRTFLPARYVAEALGYEVDWQNGKYVVVWPKGAEKPDVEAVKDYIEQQQPHVPPTDMTVTKGYTVPKNTVLKVALDGGADISILVRLQYPTEQQYKDLSTILASKYGQALADEVVSYASQKTSEEWAKAIPEKHWQVGGKILRVISNGGDMGVTIAVVDKVYG